MTNKIFEIPATEIQSFINQFSDWDSPAIIRTTLKTREQRIWLAEFAEKLAVDRPWVEIVAYAKVETQFPGGNWVTVTNVYSGHNFAHGMDSAAAIARNLRSGAESATAFSVEVSICILAGGRRFNWERRAGLESPEPILNRNLDSEDPVWTPAEALAWLKKNWRGHVSPPQDILRSLNKAYGLGTETCWVPEGGEPVYRYHITPEEFEPDGYTPYDGEAVLAKIRSSRLDFEDDEE